MMKFQTQTAQWRRECTCRPPKQLLRTYSAAQGNGRQLRAEFSPLSREPGDSFSCFPLLSVLCGDKGGVTAAVSLKDAVFNVLWIQHCRFSRRVQRSRLFLASETASCHGERKPSVDRFLSYKRLAALHSDDSALQSKLVSVSATTLMLLFKVLSHHFS